MSITLAFDIESSGVESQCSVIAIGASVVDSEFKELDSFLYANYFDEKTIFELRCWDEFWCHNSKQLNKLIQMDKKVKGVKHGEHEMINKFHEFRQKWETYAKENNLKFYLCSDNPVFDGGMINKLYHKYTNYKPLPYSALPDQTYDTLWDVHSIERGLLSCVIPEFQGDYGYSEKLKELYSCPKFEKEHDHMPQNDAYNIAMEFQIIKGIQEDRIPRL